MRPNPPPEFVITSGDLRAVGFCRSGSRSFFAAHGMDWSDFLTNGLSSGKLHEMNDALADRLIASARQTKGV